MIHTADTTTTHLARGLATAVGLVLASAACAAFTTVAALLLMIPVNIALFGSYEHAWPLWVQAAPTVIGALFPFAVWALIRWPAPGEPSS
jgi:hypothetical protein